MLKIINLAIVFGILFFISGCTAGAAGIIGAGIGSSLGGSMGNFGKPLILIDENTKQRKWEEIESSSHKGLYNVLIPYIYNVKESHFKSEEMEENFLLLVSEELKNYPFYNPDIMFLPELKKDNGEICREIKCLLDIGEQRDSDIILRFAFNAYIEEREMRNIFVFVQMLDVKNKRVLKSGNKTCDFNDEASLKAAIHSLIEQVRIDK